MSENIFSRFGKAVRYLVQGAEGWMGPGQPLPPSHQELPTRRFDYEVAWNTTITPSSRQRGRQGELSYDNLRNLADNYDLLRAVIEYRKGQIAGATWNVLSPDKDPSAPQTEEEKFATNLLQHPTPTDTWQTWIKKVMEEILVVDSVAVYPLTVNGELNELRLVDAGTLKKVISDTGETPVPPQPAYQQIIKGLPMRDFTVDQMLMRHMNPRVHKLYGFSPVEQVVMTTLIALRRQAFQLSNYTEGNIPDALASVPDSWSANDIREFQNWFNGLLDGNDGQRHKLRFLPIDASKVKTLDKKDLVDKQDEWFARIICFAFGVDPMFLVSMMNRAQSEEQHNASHEAAVLPLFEWISSLINDIFDRHGLNVRFSWESKSQMSPEQQSKVDQDDCKLGILSIDEVRKKRGYPPLNVPNMVYTPQGPIPVTAFIAGKNPILDAKTRVPQGAPRQAAQPKNKVVPLRGEGSAAKKAAGYARPDHRSYSDDVASLLGLDREESGE